MLPQVRDQFGQVGVDEDMLRTYIEVAADIEDAISAGEMPKLEAARYSAYKRVHTLGGGGGAEDRRGARVATGARGLGT